MKKIISQLETCVNTHVFTVPECEGGSQHKQESFEMWSQRFVLRLHYKYFSLYQELTVIPGLVEWQKSPSFRMLFATESQKEARKWPKGVPYSINALLTALIPPPTNTIIDMRIYYLSKNRKSINLRVWIIVIRYWRPELPSFGYSQFRRKGQKSLISSHVIW